MFEMKSASPNKIKMQEHPSLKYYWDIFENTMHTTVF